MRKFLIFSLAALVMAVALFAGNYHIITGKNGPRIVPRVTFSLSEFIVNEDALQAMPDVIRAMQYPLTVMALRAEYEALLKEARELIGK